GLEGLAVGVAQGGLTGAINGASLGLSYGLVFKTIAWKVWRSMDRPVVALVLGATIVLVGGLVIGWLAAGLARWDHFLGFTAPALLLLLGRLWWLAQAGARYERLLQRGRAPE